MEIENTTESVKGDGALLFLAEAMAEASGRGGSPITAMEKRGQQQLVNSDRLPSDCKRDRAAMEALGFTFGEPDSTDPMFMPATLPVGWKREASDHDMWSYVVDQHGRKRIAVFYKAAFYDRSAFMRLDTLWSYVRMHVEYDGPLVITNEWATREAVTEAMRQHIAENREEAVEFRGYAADTDGRDEDNRNECARIAADREATAVKYEAAIAMLEAQVEVSGD